MTVRCVVATRIVDYPRRARRVHSDFVNATIGRAVLSDQKCAIDASFCRLLRSVDKVMRHGHCYAFKEEVFFTQLQVLSVSACTPENYQNLPLLQERLSPIITSRNRTLQRQNINHEVLDASCSPEYYRSSSFDRELRCSMWPSC